MAFLRRWFESGKTETANVDDRQHGEPIMSYRAWRIVDDTLMSCTCSCVWLPRARMEARCNKDGVHAHVPAWGCLCGFYAYKTTKSLQGSIYVRMDQTLIVQGRVALWGRVIVHGLGYRAQHAYPQMLFLRGDRFDEVIRRVADRYAVDCIPPYLNEW